MVPSASASLGETGRGNSARLARRPGRDRADAALKGLCSDLPNAKTRLHDTVIRVYDEAGNVIETHQRKGDFKGA